MKSAERVMGNEESKNSAGVAASREIYKTCEIRDLYERSSGWVILCRVNYMNIVECQNGLFAANFIISDQAGSEMKCVYFVADCETAKETLSIGGYYLFTGGEAKYSAKDKELQLTFDRNSEIIPQYDVHFTVLPGRFIRIDRILEEEHGSMVNVIGVIHKIRNKDQYKSKTKFTATLCDPVRHIEVDFMLFLSSEDNSIRVGMVVVLHNYQVFKQNSIVRLNSTYKSYYFEERQKTPNNDLIQQFRQAVELTDWNTDNYRNISMFAFPQRTIVDLREICRRTEDDRIYSSLEYFPPYAVCGCSTPLARNPTRPAGTARSPPKRKKWGSTSASTARRSWRPTSPTPSASPSPTSPAAAPSMSSASMPRPS